MYKYIKRVLDFCIALILLIILAIPMIIISIAIRLDSKGPAIFKQERTGLNGNKFCLYKFRTMAEDNNVRDFSREDRHTRIGRILRKTSLDELPQLFNILLFDMSFIGPRPWIPEYYENMNEEQRHRCDVLPGITGLAQCKGRNNISIFKKIEYDLEYVNNLSLIMDIKIWILTVKTVFSKEGADAGKGTIKNEIAELKKQNGLVTEKKTMESKKLYKGCF